MNKFMIILSALIASPMIIQAATTPSALQQLGGADGKKIEAQINAFKDAASAREIAFEDWSERLRHKCLRVSSIPSILRTQEEYAKASACKNIKLPAFDFTEKSLLGVEISSPDRACEVNLLQKKVSIDQQHKKILVKIDASSEGECKMIASADFWFAIPKFPLDFSAEAEINWLGLPPPDITQEKAAQLAEEFLKGNEVDWGKPIQVLDYGETYRFYYATPKREEMLSGPRGIVVPKTGKDIGFSKRF